MCLNPIKIKNPSYRNNVNEKLNFLKDCSNQYIYVPCGHCAECIANKQMQLIQRLQMESTKNYLFMSSLTYNNKMIPIKRLPKVDKETGEQIGEWEIKYADIKDVQNMIKRLRQKNEFSRPFRYFAVSELGSKRGRPHFHIIWLLPKYKNDTRYTPYNLEKLLFKNVLKEWSRNIGSDTKPIYEPCCTYVKKYIHGELKTNYDTHYIIPELTKGGEADAGFYVLKYMMKPSERATRLQQALHLNLDLEQYSRVWNEVRPRYFKSKDFGLAKDEDVKNYIKNCIDKSKKEFDYPCYINPDGKTFPLSRFYKSKGDIYTIMDAMDFYMKKPTKTIDSSYYSDTLKTKGEADRRTEKYKRQLKTIDSHSEDFEEFNLFN